MVISTDSENVFDLIQQMVLEKLDVHKLKNKVKSIFIITCI